MTYDNIPGDTVGGDPYHPRWMPAVPGVPNLKIQPFEEACHQRLAQRIMETEKFSCFTSALLRQQIDNSLAGSDMAVRVGVSLQKIQQKKFVRLMTKQIQDSDFSHMPTLIPAPFLRRAGLFVCLAVFTACSLYAQFMQSVAVTVTDSSISEAVSATIRFAAMNEIYKTTGKGVAAFNLKPGHYIMIVTSTGYEAKTLGVDVGASEPLHITVKLPVEVKELHNITVTASNNLIESKDGKLIYNIDRSLTAQGTTAFDQVRKTPGITVDAEDNLALKGSSAVTIMIDGKLNYLGPQQLSTYLKSLPTESLQRIEVMAAPSSQYDATGNAGIINIITKKSNRQGYALNMRAGVGAGKYVQSTDGFTSNIHIKSINFFGSYNYNYNHSNLVRSSFRTVSTAGKTISYDRRSVDPAIANNNSYKAGADLYLSKATTLGVVYNGTNNSWTRNAGGPTYLINEAGKVDSIAQNKNFTDEPASSKGYNLNFSIRLDTSGAQLSADGDYAAYHDNSIGYLDNTLHTVSGAALQPYQSLNFQQLSNITIRSFKTDLALPGKKITWKAGAKYAFVTTDNNFRYDSLLNGQYVYSPTLSNHFIYDEKVAAGYASLSSSLTRKISTDAGLRLEHTSSTGKLLNTGVISKRVYTNLFPYLSLTKSFSGENRFTVSLSRRINRPLYSNLNPTRYFFDKYSYHEGNPFLQPEMSWNAGLTYNFKQSYLATVTYSRIGNAIMGFATQDTATGVFRVADRNFSHKSAADLLLVASFKPLVAWLVQTTANLIYVSYLYNDGKAFFQPHKLNVDLQVAQTFLLPKNLTVELNSFYTSPSLNGIYVLRPYFQTDAGIRKPFLNAKLDAVLSYKDIFKTDRFWAYSVYSYTSIRYDHRPDTRRINVALTYRIGGKLSAGKDRKSDEQNRL